MLCKIDIYLTDQSHKAFGFYIYFSFNFDFRTDLKI